MDWFEWRKQHDSNDLLLLDSHQNESINSVSNLFNQFYYWHPSVFSFKPVSPHKIVVLMQIRLRVVRTLWANSKLKLYLQISGAKHLVADQPDWTNR